MPPTQPARHVPPLPKKANTKGKPKAKASKKPHRLKKKKREDRGNSTKPKGHENPIHAGLKRKTGEVPQNQRQTVDPRLPKATQHQRGILRAFRPQPRTAQHRGVGLEDHVLLCEPLFFSFSLSICLFFVFFLGGGGGCVLLYLFFRCGSCLFLFFVLFFLPGLVLLFFSSFCRFGFLGGPSERAPRRQILQDKGTTNREKSGKFRDFRGKPGVVVAQLGFGGEGEKGGRGGGGMVKKMASGKKNAELCLVGRGKTGRMVKKLASGKKHRAVHTSSVPIQGCSRLVGQGTRACLQSPISLQLHSSLFTGNSLPQICLLPIPQICVPPTPCLPSDHQLSARHPPHPGTPRWETDRWLWPRSRGRNPPAKVETPTTTVFHTFQGCPRKSQTKTQLLA